MRIGLMVGSDKERSRADRLAGLLADGQAAEAAGFRVVLDSAGARLPRCDDGGRAARPGHRAHRDRNGGRPHPDPPSDDHGAAGTDHPGRVRRPVHARHRPVAPLDHRRSARAALRTTGAAGPRLPRRARRGVRRSRRGGGRQRQLPRAQPGGRHRCIRRCRCCSPRSGRRCCGSQASAPTAPSCGWPTSARSATTWCRASPRRPNAAGRSGIRVVAGVPVALCSDREVDDARGYASEVLGHADFSPNYVRLLEHGDAEDVGDTMAAGDESTVLAPTTPLPRRRCHRSRRPGGPPRRRRRPTAARRGDALRSSSRH